MGLFSHFPYTNFHELNLGWLLEKVREMDAKDDAMEARIKALEEWLQQQNIEQMVADALQEMLDNGDFNDIVAQVLGVVITPQALGFPGTKTADEVFAIMESFTINPIAIPEATYNLSGEYKLMNVVIDEGVYPGNVPIYKRDKDFDLLAFSPGPAIDMPTTESYDEAVCHLGDYWYMAVYNYNETYDYLIKMSGDFTTVLTANMTRPVPDGFSQHASRNVYTDGTYIYVDFTKNTYKYKADDLSLVATFAHDQIATEYFNGRFYGVSFSGTAVLVNTLNNDYTIAATQIVDVKHTFDYFQNITIHNNLIYMIQLPGEYSTIIDMSDWSYTNILYNDQFEIEKIAFKDGKPYALGHSIGAGAATIGEYNGGNPTNYLGRYKFDGAKCTVNLAVVNKFGIYDFENFQVGSLGDSGQMLIIDDLVLARIGKLIVSYTSAHTWKPFAATESIVISVTSGLSFRIEPNGSVHLFFQNYVVDPSQNSVIIPFDASDVYDFMGWANSVWRSGYVFGTSQGGYAQGYGVAGARVFIEKTQLEVQPFIASGSPGTVSLYGNIELVD